MSPDIGMSKRSRHAAPTVFLALVSIGSALAARNVAALESVSPRSRLTIRGTGSNIWVDHGPATAPESAEPERRERKKIAPPSQVLDEALRMKKASASDAAVISYLKRHAGQLPPMIDLETVEALRGAGAGKPVLEYLATASALELGMSWAYGGGSTAEYSVESEPEYEPGDAVQYGVPMYGGYSAPYGRSGFRIFHQRGSMHFRRGPMSIRPAFTMPPPIPSRRREFGSRTR